MGNSWGRGNLVVILSLVLAVLSRTHDSLTCRTAPAFTHKQLLYCFVLYCRTLTLPKCGICVRVCALSYEGAFIVQVVCKGRGGGGV